MAGQARLDGVSDDTSVTATLKQYQRPGRKARFVGLVGVFVLLVYPTMARQACGFRPCLVGLENAM